MESLKAAIEQALTEYVCRLTGTRPVLKPSKKAHLAASTFLRGDAARAAALLHAHAAECTLYGVPLLDSVGEDHGWLLFFFRTDALDAYASRLPDAEEPGDDYMSRRLWMIARHDDAPVPDDPFVLHGFFAALFGLPDGERLFSEAPRRLDGTARVQVEQRMARFAKILLWERRDRP